MIGFLICFTRTHNELINRTLQSSQENVTEATFRLFSITDWGEFSNHTVNGGDGSANSLESIHDGIHNDTGGTGHMGTIPVAGALRVTFRGILH